MATIFILFKDSEDSFLAALDENSIAYNPVAACSGQVMASGTLIAIVQAVASSTALAAIVVAWLKARSSRKIIVTSADNQIIHLEGYSVAEVEQILALAARVAIIDTRKPDNALNQTGTSDSA